MSYQMKLDEILESLIESNHPAASAFQTMAESLANQMGQALADHLDIEAGEGSFEGMAFAGLCVPFNPKYADQPLPECMEGHDDSGAWGEG